MANNLAESKFEAILENVVLAILWLSYLVSWASLTKPMFIMIISLGLIFNDYQMSAKEYMDANFVALLLGQIAGGFGIHYGPYAIDRFNHEG